MSLANKNGTLVNGYMHTVNNGVMLREAGWSRRLTSPVLPGLWKYLYLKDMNQIWTYGKIRAPTNLYFYIRILEWPDRGTRLEHQFDNSQQSNSSYYSKLTAVIVTLSSIMQH